MSTKRILPHHLNGEANTCTKLRMKGFLSSWELLTRSWSTQTGVFHPSLSVRFIVNYGDLKTKNLLSHCYFFLTLFVTNSTFYEFIVTLEESIIVHNFVFNGFTNRQNVIKRTLKLFNSPLSNICAFKVSIPRTVCPDTIQT